MTGKYGNEEEALISIVINDELEKAITNQREQISNYKSLIDMLECERNEKDYDWMSNYFIPEFASIMLSDASDWANQYFQTRGFVEVKLEGDNPDDEKKCNAAKVLINKTLNNREVYHFPKYIRARLINSLYGTVYALCWWETKRNNSVVGYNKKKIPTGKDIMGNPFINPITQEEMYDEVEVPVVDNSIVYDRFNYEILDPRNVFVDPKFTYSIQDKDYVIIRSEKRFNDLKRDEKTFNYFNLDLVKKLGTKTGSTKTFTEITNQENDKQDLGKPINKYYDIYDRYGKMWCIVEEVDNKGLPTKVSPGLTQEGDIKEGAELVECILTFVESGSTYILIRFEPTPFVDARGCQYRPLIRGWCYIHPTKDEGLSDGKYMKELQIALNDQFNLSNDRTLLATMPTLKGKKYALQDNDTLYFQPEHVMEVENPDDLVEFKIADDIQGSLQQQQMLKSFMEQVTARFPTAMGELPRQASTTATAISETANKAGSRGNYKSLTVEYTYLTELYFMIINQAYQFMQPETAEKIFGDKLQDFDPIADYTFNPITSSIEAEHSKYRKLQMIDQFIGRLVNVPNPKTFQVINYLLMKAFEMFGDEFPDYKKYLLDSSAPPPQPKGGEQVSNSTDIGVSNQNGIEMQSQEVDARDSQNQGMM